MNKNIAGILENQEREDEAFFLKSNHAIAEQEFTNGDQLLSHMTNPQLQRRCAGRIWNPPVVPVRKTDRVSVRKHTLSQFPYYHSHTFYEFIYVVSGECSQYLRYPAEEGQYLHCPTEDSHNLQAPAEGGLQENLSKGRLLVLHERQLAILKPGTVHALNPSRPEDLIMKMFVPEQEFRELAEAFGGTQRFFPEQGKGQQAVEGASVYTMESLQWESLLFRLLEELTYERRFQAVAVRSYLSLLLTELCRRPLLPADFELWQKLLAYLDENMAGAGLEDFAKRSGYSSGHMGRVIKERLGRTFGEVQKQRRLEKAAKLLEETDLAVEEIAVSLGYRNTSGLYKQFGSVYGMNPGTYRKAKHAGFGYFSAGFGNGM